jgi:hypothetical protein
MDTRRITRRAKKLKGGGSRQRINRKGVRVMVNSWHLGGKVFGQPVIKCFINKIKEGGDQ